MDHSIIRRCLTFLLALTFLLSLVPAQAMAEESESTVPNTTSTTEDNETTVETTTFSETNAGNNKVIAQYQQRMDNILITYLESTELSVADMQSIVDTMDWDTYQTGRMEIQQLDTEIFNAKKDGTITEQEIQTLLENNSLFLEFANALEEKNRSENSVSTLATEKVEGSVSGLNYSITYTYVTISLPFIGSSTTYYGGCTVANNSISAWAEKQTFSNTTTTIVLSVEDNTDKYLTFDYSISGGSCTFTVGSTSATISGSGTYTVRIKPNTMETLTLVCSKSKSTVTLSNFVLETPATTFNVTFQHEALGTVKTGEETIASGTTKTVGLDDGIDLTATANSGAKFLGWIDMSDYHIVSTEASFNYTNKSNATLQAVFASSTTKAWFNVNGTHLFDNLTTAAQAGTKVTLAHDGVLSGSHTIPAGVTLLIPFDTNATLCRKAPNTSDATSLTKPTPFRTLTLAEGASISVDGELSISGTQHSAMAVGTPFGPVGFIQMQSGSNITINNGGKLYAWGYITGTGTGSVTVKSGGTVYECFQVSDWRGGSATSKMSSNEEKIFPITQYYLQNVEVPMRLEAGASEYGFMSVNVTLIGIQTTLVPFVGPNAMFRITSGAIIKDYIESEDRLAIDLEHAELSISPLEISIKASLIGTITLNSANFVLPLASNMTLNINMGSKVELSQDIAFLPGTEVNIAEGAFCTVTGNSNIYVYDVEAWGPYCGDLNKKLTTIAYAPGQQKVRTENDLVDAAIKVNGTVDATDGYLYTTSVPDENGNITGGANIYSEGAGKLIQRAGTNKVTYQATYIEDGYTPHEIPIIPAKLKHEDGTYLDTSSATTATTYNHDHYTCLDHGDTTTDSTVAKCGTWYAGVHGLSEVETPPTCITEGYTTYTCTCGHSYTANKTDFADHTPAAAVQENVKKATCLEPGSYDSVIYCSVSNCGAELSRTTISVPAAGHTYVDGKCSVCGCVEVSFTIAHNLALKELVQIGYWVKAESTAEIKDVGVLIWKEADYFAEDKHDISSDTAVNPAMTSRQGFMMGYGEGIYAQYLDTKYYAVPYVVTSDGSYVYSGTPDVYAAPTYALQMGNQPEKVKTVVRDLLNYGTYAQLYFDSRPDGDIDTSTRINDVLEDAQKKLRYSDTMLVEEITADKTAENTNLSCTWRYSTAELLDAIQLNFFADQSSAFTNMLHWNETDYTAANTMKKDNATTVLNIIDKSIVEGDVTVCGSISGIYPKNLTKWHYACMYNSADNTYGPLRVDSVACYLSRMISNLSKYAGQESEYGYLLETCKAMLAYGDSAKTYAGS